MGLELSNIESQPFQRFVRCGNHDRTADIIYHGANQHAVTQITVILGGIAGTLKNETNTEAIGEYAANLYKNSGGPVAVDTHA